MRAGCGGFPPERNCGTTRHRARGAAFGGGKGLEERGRERGWERDWERGWARWTGVAPPCRAGPAQAHHLSPLRLRERAPASAAGGWLIYRANRSTLAQVKPRPNTPLPSSRKSVFPTPGKGNLSTDFSCFDSTLRSIDRRCGRFAELISKILYPNTNQAAITPKRNGFGGRVFRKKAGPCESASSRKLRLRESEPAGGWLICGANRSTLIPTPAFAAPELSGFQKPARRSPNPPFPTPGKGNLSTDFS